MCSTSGGGRQEAAAVRVAWDGDLPGRLGEEVHGGRREREWKID